jgi:hypothetical protein
VSGNGSLLIALIRAGAKFDKVGVARSPTEVTRAFARIDRTMRWQMPTLADVLKARFQISAHLRQTPLLGYPTG